MPDMIPLLFLATGVTAQSPSLDPTFKAVHPAKGQIEAAKPETAKWIWTKRVAEKQWVTLTHDLQISTQPKSARAWIVVDNYFSLSIDSHDLAQTRVDVDDVDGWKTPKMVDVTSLLTPGRHVVKIHGYNVADAAGALFRLEVNGKPALLSDESWKALDDSVGTSGAASVKAAAGEQPWGQAVSGWPVAFRDIAPYLKHLSIAPGKVANFDASSDPDLLSWAPTTSSLHLTAPSGGKDWQVVLDFGRELPGRAWLTSKSGGTVSVGTGESVGEAIKEPYTTTKLELQPNGSGASRYTAFRYMALTFPAAQTQVDLDVFVDHVYYPVTYKGSFHCSDPLLDNLWYAGAFTAHNCMQEEIWDAPKRDRSIWMGDLHVSGQVINDVFLDTFLMEKTLRHLRDDAQGANPAGQLPQSHVNGIPGYSCSWLCGMADFYKHTGDLAFVKSQQANIASLMEFFRGEIGPSGTFENLKKSWNFVDWSAGFDNDGPMARATTHFFMVKAIRDGAYLLRKCGDTAAADKYSAWADTLQEAARKLVDPSQTYSDRRQENSMAVYTGIATPSQQQAIFDQVLKPGSPHWQELATPYYNNYVIFAMGEMGKAKEALGFVRDYWGGMVQEGGTTFWELYDTSWEKHNAHAHMKTGAGGSSYALSLCHGWSAGVTSFLTEHIAGVRPLDGGFSECEIRPDLADLSFVEATVPTPNGLISLKAHKDGEQTILDLVIPRSVKVAHVSVEGGVFASRGNAQTIDLGPGHHKLVSTKARS